MLNRIEVQKVLDMPIPDGVIQPPLPGRGIFGEYVTGQWVVQEANTQLGFDSWDVRDVQTQLFNTPDGDMVFVTTLWVTLFYLDDGGSVRSVSRPGRGVGIAYIRRERSGNEVKVVPPKPIEIDTACKASLTDAIKNAWARFGRHFGGELYFDERMAQIVFTNYFDEQEPVQPATGQQPAQEKVAEKVVPPPPQQPATEAVAPKTEPTVMMWFGREMPAHGKPGGMKLSQNATFRSFVMSGLDMDRFSPTHPRLINHLKKHFGINNLDELTWEMLQALRTLCVEGRQRAAEAFPQYYAGERAITRKTAMHLEELSQETDSPDRQTDAGPVGEVNVGGLQVPARIVAMFRDLFPGDDWADRFLQIVGGVDSWSDRHTEYMEQLIRGAKNSGLTDIGVLRQLWVAVTG